jgi:hypothetical protein
VATKKAKKTLVFAIWGKKKKHELLEIVKN